MQFAMVCALLSTFALGQAAAQGRGAGTLKPGRHVRHAAGTPFSNLLLSMMDRMNVPLDRVSDSTGRLPGLA